MKRPALCAALLALALCLAACAGREAEPAPEPVRDLRGVTPVPDLEETVVPDPLPTPEPTPEPPQTVVLFGREISLYAEELEYEDIPLTSDDLRELEDLLPLMPCLRKVALLRCGIPDEEMDALNKRHDGVEFVWMVRCRNYGVRTDQTWFTQFNCPYYYTDAMPPEADNFEAFRYCHDMTAIDFGHLHDYGDTSFFTEMPHLRYLVLSMAAYDSIPELASLKELEVLEMTQTQLKDLSPLLGCPGLTHLNIVWKTTKNWSTDDDIEVLCAMPQLKRLFLAGGSYTREQKDRLRAALPDTELVEVFAQPTVGWGWRDCPEYYEMRDALHIFWMDGDGNTVLVNPYTGKRSDYEDETVLRRAFPYGSFHFPPRDDE